MPARKFERIALVLLLLGGCAVVFGECGLMGHAQAQAPPPPPVVPPTQAPVFNPSSPNTVQQPSYTPLAPATPSATPSSPSTVPSTEVTPPENEQSQNTTTRSERRSVAKTRYVHRHRGHFAEATLGSYYCGYSPCFRVYPSALYGYAAPAYGVVAPAPVYAASGLWWPGFYDYAPGQWGRGHPRYWGYWRRAGYHGD
jgi:hypothetical protein